MQQIINFFIRNSYRLLFLLLIGVSLFLTIKSHSYHRSAYINSANRLVGSVYSNANSINEYLNLKSENEALATENARLKQLLFNAPDTLIGAKRVKQNNDVVYTISKAKVVKNIYNTRENYLTVKINKKDTITTDMGVINDRGIIGIVEKTSRNFATVQSVLNTKSKINAKIKNTDNFGTLIWDGVNVGYVQLVDVPRLASIRKGDSIVTGAESEIFPENIPIGKIENAFINKKTNYYTINVRLFNDMTALGYVYIIENSLVKEKQELEENTKANTN